LPQMSYRDIEHLAAVPATYAVPASARRVYVQLGANLQPLLPMDSETFVLLNDASPDVAFKLAQRLKGRNDSRFVWRAIANQTGTLSFHITSEDNIGATLIKSRGGTGRTGDRTVSVAASSLLDMLRPLPAHLPLTFLTSNIEGFDYTAFEQFFTGFDPTARGTQLAIAEIDTNGMARFRGPSSVPPNEFRHFDALRARIGWRWVGCVADAGAIMPCILTESSAECLASSYARPLLGPPIAGAQTTPRVLILPQRIAPPGFKLHRLGGDHLAVLTVRSRTVPISKLERPAAEAMEREDFHLAQTLIDRCTSRPTARKLGSWYHPMSRLREAANRSTEDLAEEHRASLQKPKSVCHSLFRWVHCAMAPRRALG